ncbi:hypothetical protein WDW37_19845 [Bdellovibrionota bacterium FG-1]
MRKLKNGSLTTLTLLGLLMFGLGSGSVVLAGDGSGTSGGGGITPPEGVSSAWIKNSIRQSRLSLYLYFNSQAKLYRASPSPVGKLLFEGAHTVFEMIQTTSIELNEEGPCLDPAHEEKDGAAPGSQPNSICISVKNLAQKLNSDNYWNQTIALVGHEFSHLLGANEAQALEIQKSIIEAYRKIPKNLPGDLRIQMPTPFERVLGWSRFVKTMLNDLWVDPKALDEHLSRQFGPADEILSKGVFVSEGLSGLDISQTALWWEIFWKLRMLQAAGCARNPESYRMTVCQGELDRAFGTDLQVSLPVLVKRMNSQTPIDDLADVVIRRIDSEATLKVELDEVIETVKRLLDGVNTLPPLWGSYLPKDPDLLPVLDNSIEWRSNRVLLTADDFHIGAEGVTYYGSPSFGDFHSDPGNPDYWTFEAEWMENGREMRLFIYFAADEKHWWATEIRTYDGRESSNWHTYQGRFFESPLGVPFQGDLDLIGISEKGVAGSLHFRNLKIQTTLH